MQNNKSPFRKDKYDQWDSVAKQAVRSYLLKQNYELATDIEDYDADIKTTKPVVSHHEVEVKLSWSADWPESWNTIHIPYRKKRLIDKIDSPDSLTFYVLKKNLKEAWTIKGSQCLDIIEVPNKFVSSGEYFFNIPIKNAKLINLR